ncbi:stage V sporulation protein AA [Bacillus altitudinis]|uniref:Stage V sporulation protein AA n=1 Tax=Bacillus aerius TaxID=293388 RepID=A0ABR6B4A7_9BACI|nr:MULTISPECIES: stage V sporulation protein AA [Bacillus]KML00129.1 stage V sporulation protein AA [Bacillus stratosphericus]MBR3379349.1 stage V sporulation protein AA [Bacillus sp. (in: firmicutes)]AKC66501.1 stage V sporulation protein AA [Bacillus altitudinis]KML18737.1 stage V sporulation protein AA [Bacillus stratosphericus]KML47548.1 stage V sporulation protein AA [Bacillus stratosphericus]
MDGQIFIRLRHRIKTGNDQLIYLEDIAQITGDDSAVQKLSKMPIYHVSKKDRHIVVLDIMHVVKTIKKAWPDIDIQTVGGSEAIVEIDTGKRQLSPVLFVFVWLLLFVGAALAIMNFHEDVSMRLVHIRLYEMITGNTVEHPYLLQIPYSFGLGLGMILFFNHVFKKRLNEEPSPLEVEMFKYQLDLDHYVALNENKETLKDIHDR